MSAPRDVYGVSDPNTQTFAHSTFDDKPTTQSNAQAQAQAQAQATAASVQEHAAGLAQAAKTSKVCTPSQSSCALIQY